MNEILREAVLTEHELKNETINLLSDLGAAIALCMDKEDLVDNIRVKQDESKAKFDVLDAKTQKFVYAFFNSVLELWPWATIQERQNVAFLVLTGLDECSRQGSWMNNIND